MDGRIGITCEDVFAGGFIYVIMVSFGPDTLSVILVRLLY